MTSQKRYRHHEGNSTSRFRDIPPRFKRQKSSSSPKPENFDNQENQGFDHPSTVSPHQPSCATGMMSPLPSNNVVNNTHPSDNAPHYQSRTDSNPVLSQVENFNRFDLSESNWIPVETRQLPPAGFASPPLYTWESQHVMPVSNTHIQNQRLFSYQPLMSRHDNVSPSLEMAQVKPDAQTYGSRTVSPLSATSSPAPTVVDGHASSSPDYSDPDIRTIEMLRELERVADEKEKEDENDPTVDRKNLVSHHLRMLMCAVDRYTEGVEDDDIPKERAVSHQSDQNPTSKKKLTYQNNGAQMKGQSGSKKKQLDSPIRQQVAWEGQNHEQRTAWQSATSRKARSQLTQPAAMPAMVQTPPPAPNVMVSTNTPSVSPCPSRTSSPFVHQAAYPKRAITKYSTGQGFADQAQQIYPTACLNNSCSPSFSPASSPPLQGKNVWGPAILDSPTDAKSWDLWSGPSFFSQVYPGQPEIQPVAQINGQSFPPTTALYPFVPVYAPVDVKEQMPLYRR